MVFIEILPRRKYLDQHLFLMFVVTNLPVT